MTFLGEIRTPFADTSGHRIWTGPTSRSWRSSRKWRQNLTRNLPRRTSRANQRRVLRRRVGEEGEAGAACRACPSRGPRSRTGCGRGRSGSRNIAPPLLDSLKSFTGAVSMLLTAYSRHPRRRRGRQWGRRSRDPCAAPSDGPTTDGTCELKIAARRVMPPRRFPHTPRRRPARHIADAPGACCQS